MPIFTTQIQSLVTFDRLPYTVTRFVNILKPLSSSHFVATYDCQSLSCLTNDTQHTRSVNLSMPRRAWVTFYYRKYM